MSRKRKRVQINCDQCGNPFEIQICYLKRKRQHHFCCKPCEWTFNKGKEKQQIRYQINLQPCFELGWICGAIMGDGSVWKHKTSAGISFSSNSKELQLIFKRFLTKVIPNSNPTIYMNKITSSGNKAYMIFIGCKNLYEVLKPFKPKPYVWFIPDFLTTVESIDGFISGLFDADGCVTKDHKYNGKIRASSKFKGGLEQIQFQLKKRGISSSIYQGSIFELCIGANKSIKLFEQKINFMDSDKRKYLTEITSNFYIKNKSYFSMKDRYTAKDYHSVMNLRNEKGWGSIKISAFLNINLSAVDRWLYRGDIPLAVRVQ